MFDVSFKDYWTLVTHRIESMEFSPFLKAVPVEKKVLWLLDSKPYWRTRYYPGYKANSENHPLWAESLEQMKMMSLNVWGIDTLEADDLAALIVNSQFWKGAITFLTCDSDWMGLLRPGVWMMEALGRTPDFRTTAQAFTWAKSKWNKGSAKARRDVPLPEESEFSPSWIWKWKARVGDSGKGVRCNAPLELFDLNIASEVIGSVHIPGLKAQINLIANDPRRTQTYDPFDGVIEPPIPNLFFDRGEYEMFKRNPQNVQNIS